MSGIYTIELYGDIFSTIDLMHNKTTQIGTFFTRN